VAGLGKLAVAPKLAVHVDADWKYEYVFPQAVIDPGDVVLAKFDGEDWNVTDSRSAGTVVDDEVCVTVWNDCEVDVVCVTD